MPYGPPHYLWCGRATWYEPRKISRCPESKFHEHILAPIKFRAPLRDLTWRTKVLGRVQIRSPFLSFCPSLSFLLEEYLLVCVSCWCRRFFFVRMTLCIHFTHAKCALKNMQVAKIASKDLTRKRAKCPIWNFVVIKTFEKSCLSAIWSF